ncbi:MAG: hypothetical protein WC243_01285 [Patescibacteria group bacterium]|jgi:peptidoglycan hydrolase CwlO-like protein
MKYKLLLLTLASVFLFLTGTLVVFAQDTTPADNSEEVQDLEKKIEEYEEKLEGIKSEKASLQKEISFATTQISLTEARIAGAIAEIAQKNREIQELAEDIQDLGLRIDKLLKSISFQQDVLSERKRAYYKIAESTPPDVELLFFLVSPSTLAEKIQKFTYSEVMQDRDKKLLLEMEKTKEAYTKQKGLFEETKLKEEQLKQQVEARKVSLDNYKVDLVDQKASKDKLLRDTQNNEAKYQELLDDARREFEQIVGAASALRDYTPRKVKAGEQIGIQGNTGRSYGDHLHFGVYKYGSLDEIVDWNWYYDNYVDPAKKLKSKTVTWDTGCESTQTRTVGSGDWKWPMSSPTISQGFGHTCYSNLYYGGKAHPAWDMWGSYGSPIYAVEDGDAYFCRNCLGDGGNGVFIFHDDGYMTLYWHLR